MSVRRLFACAALLLTAGVAAATAQEWPAKTVQVISFLGPGNANDAIARVVLEQTFRQMNATYVIENRPGAGGTIGVNSVAKADPDGYTLLLNSSTLSSQVVLHKSLPFDPVRDLQPIALFGIQPSVLVSTPSRGFKTVADLVAAAKAKPGSLNFASAGLGSASHMAAERFRNAAKLDVQHVPFNSPGQALSEVIAGRIDYYYLPLAAAAPLLKDGKLTLLAVSTPERAPQLPDVPTIVEAGYPDAKYLFWSGIAGPAKLPKPIVDKLHAEVEKALQTADVKDKLYTLGLKPQLMSVADFTKFAQDDVASTIKLAKDINLNPPN